MKIDWNRKYTTIAVYAVLVVIASLVCYNVLHNFTSYKAGVPAVNRHIAACYLRLLHCFCVKSGGAIFLKKKYGGVSAGKSFRRNGIKGFLFFQLI